MGLELCGGPGGGLPLTPTPCQRQASPVCSHCTPGARRSGSPRLMSLSLDPRHSTDRVLYHSSASSSGEDSPSSCRQLRGPSSPAHVLQPESPHPARQGARPAGSVRLPHLALGLLPQRCPAPTHHTQAVDLDQPTACSRIPSPESQVKVRAESSVNMMATACLLVSLGSRVTHLTLLISVTWNSIHKVLGQVEAPPSASPMALPPPGGSSWPSGL